MKNFYFLIIALTLSLFRLLSAYSQDSNDDFYDINTINKIELTFAEANWDEILSQYYKNGNDERLSATAVINGQTYDSVGVKYKGNSSYKQTRNLKKPLNIKLDYIIGSQDIDGYGTLKLSNGFKDPSFIREVLGYEIARKYTSASKANYANVYINDELIGFYTSVQSVDKTFLGRHYHSSNHVFVKGDRKPGPGPGAGATLRYIGPDTTKYMSSYQMNSDYGWRQLVDLIDTLNNKTSAIEEILDVDAALWHMAFHNLLLGLDSPINAPRNFYLYRDLSNRFSYILWDLNQVFGTYTQELPKPVTLTSLQQLDPFHNSNNPKYSIVYRLLRNPAYMKIYVAHMKTIMNENFVNGWYADRAREIQALVRDDVIADKNKFHSNRDFDKSIDQTVGQGPQFIPGITELMEGRISFLQSHEAFITAGPDIANVEASAMGNTGKFSFRVVADVSDADKVLLAYRNSLSDRFAKVQMFDDGKHSDNSAGDGIYGIEIEETSHNIQYYIVAESEESVKFSPERAEYEYYTLTAGGGLVINEFMADNAAYKADESGEFDDWIELFNGTGDDISLSGYFLSDNGEELSKWPLPDIILEAGGYLVVWADKDEEQGSLHSNFKISASGEAVYLADSDGNIIDEVAFGPQAADISYGRYPNGSGPFRAMLPTFMAVNELATSNDEPGLSDSFSGYNNVLRQNRPNPFSQSTIINFELTMPGYVVLKVYGVMGNEITTLVNEFQSAGSHRATFDAKKTGNRLPEGMYYYTIRIEGGAKSGIKSGNMILIR